MLKDHDNIVEQDIIFKKICDDIGWEFYPTPDLLEEADDQDRYIWIKEDVDDYAWCLPDEMYPSTA
jgi:hypothetical protein